VAPYEIRRRAGEDAVRVLGVDPGTVVTGWGVIDCHRGQLRHVDSGTIRAGRGNLPARLAMIYAELGEVARRHAPDAFSLERNFLARNVQSAFRLGEARGVAMAAAALAGLPLSEYTPATVKKTVTGHGGARKCQVQDAVLRLLALSRRLAVDESDALAVAACHALRMRYQSRVSVALTRIAEAPVGTLRVKARVLG
jgi:crossover junction endodeoxyribonuclease RuvC